MMASDILSIAYRVADRLTRSCVRRVGREYGGGDYGDGHEARSAANLAVATILRDGIPSETNPVDYVRIRVRWAVMTEWNNCSRSRRGRIQGEFDGERHAVRIEHVIEDRLTLASVASVMGYDAFSKILTADECVDAIYLPNGIRLRSDPSQPRRHRWEKEHIDRVRNALGLRQDVPLPRSVPTAPGTWRVLTCSAPGTSQGNTPHGDDITAPSHPNKGAAMALHILRAKNRCWGEVTTCIHTGDDTVPVVTEAATCDATGFREVSDEEWTRVKSLLKMNPRNRTDPRAQLNGVRWVLYFGAPYTAVPAQYGAPNTVYDSYKRWRVDAIAWSEVARILNIEGEMEVRGMNKRSSPRRPRQQSLEQARARVVAGRARGLLRDAIEQVRNG